MFTQKIVLKNISKEWQNELFDSLYYMNISELKNFCNTRNIPFVGKKGSIIKRIKHYLLTGKILHPKKMPSISKAKPNTSYLLKPETRILHGSYKNDLKTRKFFQTLIGKHFHFTAFGQDWIMTRWMQGKPPTYAQFVKMWQQEYKRRQNIDAKPRQEWAYLNFMQRFTKENPNASRKAMTVAWKKTRAERVETVLIFLNDIQI
jgi:hypothetical protein